MAVFDKGRLRGSDERQESLLNSHMRLAAPCIHLGCVNTAVSFFKGELGQVLSIMCS